MADRTSAGIFADLFKMLAQHPSPEHKEVAQRIYEMSRNYDFSEYQMYADEACLILGVARMGMDPGYPEDGEVLLWPGRPGYPEPQEIEGQVEEPISQRMREIIEVDEAHDVSAGQVEER